MSPRRKELLRLGRRGRLVRVVEALQRGLPVIVVLYRTPDGKRVSRFYTRKEKGDALAFAEGLAEEQAKPKQVESAPRLTVEQIWTRYFADISPSLRPRSRVLYWQYWKLFQNFAGPHNIAEDLTIETMIALRALLEREGRAVNSIRRVMGVARMVFRWAEIHELISKNRVGRYVYKVAKESRPVSPDEYRDEEFRAILATLDPNSGSQWRSFVALTICGLQGARQGAVLHLTWDDIDLEAGTITWRARWDKMGRERVQPMRAGTREALAIAATRRRPGSNWILPGFNRKGEDLPYTIQGLWGALTEAEKRANIPHIERRGGHGLRRLLAGEVHQQTGSAKTAMDAIGDGIDQAPRYIKPRHDEMERAFAALDSKAAETRNSEQDASKRAPTEGPGTDPIATDDRTGV